MSAQHVPLAPGDSWNCNVTRCWYLVSDTDHQVQRGKDDRDSGVKTCWFKVAERNHFQCRPRDQLDRSKSLAFVILPQMLLMIVIGSCPLNHFLCRRSTFAKFHRDGVRRLHGKMARRTDQPGGGYPAEFHARSLDHCFMTFRLQGFSIIGPLAFWGGITR